MTVIRLVQNMSEQFDDFLFQTIIKIDYVQKALIETLVEQGYLSPDDHKAIYGRAADMIRNASNNTENLQLQLNYSKAVVNILKVEMALIHRYAEQRLEVEGRTER